MMADNYFGGDDVDDCNEKLIWFNISFTIFKWWCKYCSSQMLAKRLLLQGARLSSLAFQRQGSKPCSCLLSDVTNQPLFKVSHNVHTVLLLIFFLCQKFDLDCVWGNQESLRFLKADNFYHSLTLHHDRNSLPQPVWPCQQHLWGPFCALWRGEHLHIIRRRQYCLHTGRQQGKQSF